MAEELLNPVTIDQIRRSAEQKLPAPFWRYYEDGADDQVTLRRNRQVYDELRIRPRVLRDVAKVHTRTTVLGRQYDVPFAIAPTAYQKLASPGGEIDMARASVSLGSNITLSSNATTSLEDVAAALPERDATKQSPGPWFQLYFIKDRGVTTDLIKRADKAGYEALVLTVDTTAMGNRVHERHHPLTLPDGIRMANKSSREGGGVSKGRLVLNASTAAEAEQIMAEHGHGLIDPGLTWDETVPWLRSQTSMKIIIKGVLTAEDAMKAVEVGVDAVVVSNHGGRQLDGVPATLEALPEVVDAVKGQIPVIFDGGITHGSDIFKALALGADLCLLGRCALWGLAHDGQKGVETVMNILERELHRTMVLTGAKSVADISRDMLGVRSSDGFGIRKL